MQTYPRLWKRGIGVEQAGVAAVDDAQGRHGGDGRVGPVVLIHIREGVVGGQVVVPHVLVQQAEEDGGHLGPGDVGVGPHGAPHCTPGKWVHACNSLSAADIPRASPYFAAPCI